MLIFREGHIPPMIPVLHLGFGPDAFIANSGWFANYTATYLYYLHWLCASRDRDKHELMRQNLAIPEDDASNSYEDLLYEVFSNDQHQDAVVCITTQTEYHAEHIVQAVNAGAKFIMVDKPLVRTLAELLRVKEAVEAADATLFLTYNHQFCAPVHQIRHLAQTVGVKSVKSWFLQSWLNQNLKGLRQFDWRTADPLCGPLDIWSHAENLASFVLGQKIASVEDVRLGTGGGHGQGEIFTSGTCTANFAGGIKGEISFDQTLEGHLDDIGVCVTLNDGRHVMWRLELGVDNLWVSKWHDADLSGTLTNWTRTMRGSSAFDPRINATFNETPAGHHDGWSTMWRYLFTAAAGAMYRKRGLDLGFGDNEPPILSLPVPGFDAAEQTARFVEAAVRAHETNTLQTL